jgi:hypothetical protein
VIVVGYGASGELGTEADGRAGLRPTALPAELPRNKRTVKMIRGLHHNQPARLLRARVF